MKRYLKLTLFLCGLFLLSFGFAAYANRLGPPLPYYRQETQVSFPVKPSKVTTETAVYIQESYSFCRQSGFSCADRRLLTGEPRRTLNGKGSEEISLIYGSAQGWQLQWEAGGAELRIWRAREGFCPEHGRYWHFEEGDKGNIEVYRGPAGSGRLGERTLSTTIKVQSLPEAYQEKVRTGSWQFRNRDELQNVIDSLDS
jgi:hypothetical protein